MAIITGKTVLGYKISEILDLDARGLVMQFTYPTSMATKTEIEILNSMMETAQRAGSPYLLTRVEDGCYAGKVIMWKEKKSIRCKKCGNFLNARPEKYKLCVTHKQVGKTCADMA